MTPNESPAAPLPARWYVVNRYGAATLCVDEDNAHGVANECDLAWPANAPHVAVQLAPVASESRGSVPDGWRLVPSDDGRTIWVCGRGLRVAVQFGDQFWAFFKAMLAAAPTPPAVASGEPPDWAIVEAVFQHFGSNRETEDPSCDCDHCKIVRHARELARSAAANGERQEKPR